MIVWLASYPRSGNTFARLLFHHLYGVPLPSVYLPATPAGENKPLAQRPLLPELICEMPLSMARNSPEPVLVKTHEMPSDDAPAIYLVRDGRDALVSHAHYVLNFDLKMESTNRGQFLDVLQKLIESDNSFGGWDNNVRAWTTRTAPTAVIRFEELVSAPVESIRAAIAVLGLPFVEREQYQVPQFTELHARIPNFFRRGGVDNWRDEMPDDLHELFWQRHGAVMNAMGYTRDGRRPSVTSHTTSAA